LTKGQEPPDSDRSNPLVTRYLRDNSFSSVITLIVNGVY